MSYDINRIYSSRGCQGLTDGRGNTRLQSGSKENIGVGIREDVLRHEHGLSDTSVANAAASDIQTPASDLRKARNVEPLSTDKTMKNIVDENGFLNVEDLIMNSPSFQKMMEDNIITEEEIQTQSELVISLLTQLESTCSEEQKELLRKLLAEICVLVGVNGKGR